METTSPAILPEPAWRRKLLTNMRQRIQAMARSWVLAGMA
jgi:hypothetical protein